MRSHRDGGRLMARRARTTPGTHPSGPLPTAAARRGHQGTERPSRRRTRPRRARPGGEHRASFRLRVRPASRRRTAVVGRVGPLSAQRCRGDAVRCPARTAAFPVPLRRERHPGEVRLRLADHGAGAPAHPDARHRRDRRGGCFPCRRNSFPAPRGRCAPISAWLLHDPDGVPLCVLLVENQSRADRTMPERITVHCAGLREMLGNRRPGAPPPDILPFVVSTARGKWRVPTGTEPSRLPEAYSGHARFSFGYNVLDVGRRPDLDDSREPVALFLRIRWMAAKRNPSPDDRRRLTLLASRARQSPCRGTVFRSAEGAGGLGGGRTRPGKRWAGSKGETACLQCCSHSRRRAARRASSGA